MAQNTATAVSTVSEILAPAQAPTRALLKELLEEMHPGLPSSPNPLTSLFQPQSAAIFLKQLNDLERLFTESDTYEQTIGKLQDSISKAEATRDKLLAKVFDQLRPVEKAYRSIDLFFENAKVGSAPANAELHVLNADPSVIEYKKETQEAIEAFIDKRNNTFNFRSAICNLVIPGFLPGNLQDSFEKLASDWGMLLISDLDDHRSTKDVKNHFNVGGNYEFLTRNEDQAAAHVALVGWLQVREKYGFENIPGPMGDKARSDDGLYIPPSLLFAGAIARTDEAKGVIHGPIGTRFGQIAGAAKCRIEPSRTAAEDLSMNKQVIPIIRDANNRLCFYGCRTLAFDPYGVYKFFTSYRAIRHIERQARQILQDAAGVVLSRQTVDDYVDKPLRSLMQGMKDNGTLIDFRLTVDRDSRKLMQGICDIDCEVLPNGPGETFVLKLDTPDFSPGQEDQKKA